MISIVKYILRRFSGIPTEKQLKNLLQQQNRQKQYLHLHSQSYKQCLQQMELGQYKQAFKTINNIKSYLKNEELLMNDVKQTILRTQAKIISFLGYPQRAQILLRQSLKDNRQSNSILSTYLSYQDLLNFYLQFNISKAILLSRALLQKQAINIPYTYLKYFQFCLGTAYILDSNFKDAKFRLRKVISSNPNQRLKAMAYNNLSVAQLWDKQTVQQEKQSSRNYLKRSFELLVKCSLQEWINQQKQNEEQMFHQIDKMSIKVLQNLCQFQENRLLLNTLTKIIKNKHNYKGRAHLILIRFLIIQNKKQQANNLFKHIQQQPILKSLALNVIQGTKVNQQDFIPAKLLYLLKQELI